jgi:hypothetical protein
MRSGKRKVQPLNFTPEENAKDRPVADARPAKAKPAGRSAAAPADAPPLASRWPSAGGLPPSGVGRHAYLIATIASVAWAGLLFAYTIGYVGGVAGLLRAPMQLAVVTLMALLPGAFVFAAAFAVKQGARLAAEARWARSLSDDLVSPVASAAARTGDIVAAMRAEIDRAAATATSAHDRMVAVREALAGEGVRLTETAAEAQLAARVVGETLARERDGVTALLASLNAQADEIGRAMERQSRLVGEASDLARSQLEEAQATLAVGAARLSEAGAQVGVEAREAGEGLSHQAERLDTSAAALSERLRFLEARLTDQRNALGALTEALEVDKDDVAARLETQRAQLMEIIIESRASAAEIGVAATTGAEALRELIATGAQQTRDIGDAARQQQADLRNEAAEARMETQNELHRTLDTLARMGEEARRALALDAEQAQSLSAERLAAAKAEVEQLGELAFAAGQRADQALQSRLLEVRRGIDQTTAEVERASEGALKRIEDSLAASRTSLIELAQSVTDLDGRLVRLPEAAQRQVEALRLATERGLQDLTAAARHAAEETQTIDQAFQSRIKQNYESLSEAVRLMGRAVSSGDGHRAEPPRSSESGMDDMMAPPSTPLSPLSDAFGGVRRPDAGVQAARPVFGPRPAPPAPTFGRATAREEAAFDAELLLQPAAPKAAPAPAPPEARDLARPAAAPAAPAAPTPEAKPADLPVAAPVEAAAPEPALRPRLRLTPTEDDRVLQDIFAPVGAGEGATSAREPAGRAEWGADLDEWTWKDLLSSMDDAPATDDLLAQRLAREIDKLGVDAAALLPQARIEDIAAALGAGDTAAARDRVRRLAPAAIRRLSRRVLTDKPLRDHADRFVEQYRSLLQSARAEGSGTPASLLANESGRAYLLLEAAVGEL